MKRKTKIILLVIVIIISLIFIYSEVQRKNNSPKILSINFSFWNFSGITIPPFGIIVNDYFFNGRKDGARRTTIAHETIHWKQFQKLGLLKFYGNYFFGFAKSGYSKNAMEQEAFLKVRKIVVNKKDYDMSKPIDKSIIPTNYAPELYVKNGNIYYKENGIEYFVS